MIITSRKNEQVSKYRLLCADRKARREQTLFPLEGVRLIMEAVAEKVPIPIAFVTLKAAEKYAQAYDELLAYAGQVLTVSDSVADYIGDTKTPQGFFAAGEILDKILHTDTIESNGRYMVLESLQDPGNMGTIIRTADAMGLSGLILSPDCVDPYTPKVVRASMGALFRMPIYFNEPTDAIELLKSKGIEVFAAVVDASAPRVTDCDFSGGCAVVIGNEGAGVTLPTRYSCSGSITIPMRGHTESLNAAMAAGLFMWEMSR